MAHSLVPVLPGVRALILLPLLSPYTYTRHTRNIAARTPKQGLHRRTCSEEAMAPKKRADAHSNVPAALKAHGVTCPTEISDLLLHKLYKLADADLQEGPHVVTEDSDNEEPLGGPLHTYLAHEDAWVDQQFLTHALEVWEQSSSNPKKRKAKAGDKGKGKAKQQEECTPELCRDNPRCLNWLGQASWEASGSRRASDIFYNKDSASRNLTASRKCFPCVQGSLRAWRGSVP